MKTGIQGPQKPIHSRECRPVPLIIPKNGVKILMIDGGGKFLRIIMNKASFDQDSPSVFPWPRGSGSRSVL